MPSLRDNADAFSRDPMRGVSRDVFFIEENLSRPYRGESHDSTHQGGFSYTVSTNHTDHLLWHYLKRKALKNVAITPICMNIDHV